MFVITTVNECLNPDIRRCENGGTCIPVENDAKCVCQSGYTGDFCEVNIDECDPNPCVNGKCTDGIASFTCICDTGLFFILESYNPSTKGPGLLILTKKF